MAKTEGDLSPQIIAAFNKINRDANRLENLIDELIVEFRDASLPPDQPTNQTSPDFWFNSSKNNLIEVKADLVKALVLK